LWGGEFRAGIQELAMMGAFWIVFRAGFLKLVVMQIFFFEMKYEWKKRTSVGQAFWNL